MLVILMCVCIPLPQGLIAILTTCMRLPRRKSPTVASEETRGVGDGLYCTGLIWYQRIDHHSRIKEQPDRNVPNSDRIWMELGAVIWIDCFSWSWKLIKEMWSECSTFFFTLIKSVFFLQQPSNLKCSFQWLSCRLVSGLEVSGTWLLSLVL